MRIRSIRPEFWSSEDVAAMSWETRLVYIGLWSYVDDNGVGRDKVQLVTAALFALDDETIPGGLPESSRRVTGALQHLSDHGQITRYVVDGKPYLHITAWNDHQRIEKASKGRYPLPTCENAEIPEPSPTTPVALPDMSSLGEGEKGRRGEGEKVKDLSDKSDAMLRFDEFWDTYDNKVDRKGSQQKWRLALKKPGVTPDMLIEAARSYVAWERANRENGRFIMGPAKWLLNERWTDEKPGRNVGAVEAPAASRSTYLTADQLEELGDPPDDPEGNAAWWIRRREMAGR